ncbi:MAG: hypothetical protein U9R25_01050 [Chloroflexota bacterium]|nr:hypothetical protein [Chloroflexota bacterium]
MNCISPPALEDTMLLMWADGETSPEVISHLARCDYCRNRANAVAIEKRHLEGILFRAECPSSIELGEFHASLLPANQAAEISTHVASCPHCALELVQLERFLIDTEPREQSDFVGPIKERVQVLIAKLAGNLSQGLQSPAFAPAFAGVRGAGDTPMVYDVTGEMQIVLDLQASGESPGSLDVLGLVTGLGQPVETQAHLWQEGQWIAAANVDDLGNFLFASVSPAQYDIILSAPALEVHIQELELEKD